MIDRTLPNDVAAEEAVIGSLLVDGEALPQVMSTLKPQDFHQDKCRWCYEACLELHKHDVAINEITLAHELGIKKRLEAIGGSAYLSHLVSILPSSVYLKHYAGIVRQTALMRQMITTGHAIQELGYGEYHGDEELLALARKHLNQLERQVPSVGRPSDLGEAILRLLDPPEKGTGLHIPWPTVERMTGPMRSGQLWVLGGKTSQGKTTALLQVGIGQAREGRVVLYCTAEEQIGDLALRIAAMIEGIDIYGLIRTGPRGEEADKITDASGWAGGAHLWTPVISQVEDVELWYDRCLGEEGHVDLVLVDYIQRLRPGKVSEYEETSRVVKRLKSLALEWQTPVLAASQLSRTDKTLKMSKKPGLEDLRGSGRIEEEADNVIFLYRPETGGLGAKQKAEQSELIVAKSRLTGQLGVVAVDWNARNRSYQER